MILHDELEIEIATKNLIPDNQAGFRVGKRTMDNIFILNHIIENEICKEKDKIFAIFVDLKAAFAFQQKSSFQNDEKNGYS